MAKYTVSMRVDGRVDVEVDAVSFDRAFAQARCETFDPNMVEVVEFSPVNATDENGNTEDYNG